MKSADVDSDMMEFVCKPEYCTAIPSPVPASKILPDWYKNLDGRLDNGARLVIHNSKT
jgi:hypothetical protein